MTTRLEAQLYHRTRDEAVLRGKDGGGAGAGAGTTPVRPTAPKSAPSDTAPKGQPDVRIEVARKPAPASPPAGKPAPQDDAAALLFDGQTDDGFGDLNMFNTEQDIFAGAAGGTGAGAEAPPRPQSRPGAAGQDRPADMAERLAALKDEKLSQRQLRIAQRIAAMHEIDAATGEEAVVLLRLRGIDPFHRDALRRAVAEEGARANARPAPNAPVVGSPEAGGAGLPAKTPAAKPPAMPRGKAPLPTSGALSEERRAAEIFRIQRDIARRRRRRLTMLLLRLAAFVLIPTIITGWYYFRQATPLYATFSQFQIQQAQATSGGLGGLAGMLAGTQLATNPDSVAVQSYLTSRDAMLRLDQDMGFKRVFQDPSIDPLTRLAPDATNEMAYKTYKGSVRIGYDPSEGVINMEVVAPDADLSRDFSLALIHYAEEQVDQMTARLRADQMQGAIESQSDAEAGVYQAQARVQELQQRLGVLDPVAEGGVIMGQIASMEAELVRKQLELGTLEANLAPNASRVNALRGEIDRLREMIGQTRLQLTEGNDARTSLAAVAGELRLAEADLLTRQQLLAATLAQVEAARLEANRQVRYLSLSVAPIAPDEATYPRAGQNTFVAFLIFSGIYLMLSLTASILREQVSS